MGNIPSKPVVVNQEWTNGVTKLNQTNLTSGVNQNITNIKTAVDGIIDALGGPGADPENFEEITYAALKALRDAGQLVPGKQYRITDYVTTCANNEEARSAGHPFDVIVTADSESVLSEDARAALHEGDEYFGKAEKFADWIPGVTISDIKFKAFLTEDLEVNYADDDEKHDAMHDTAKVITQLTKLANIDGVEVPAMLNPDPDGDTSSDVYYVYIGVFTLDGVTYDLWQQYSDKGGFASCYYLTNRLVDLELGSITSTLSKWAIKYSLDNDTSRFAWADATNGKGVIYYMKDEWGNECPYDFKNIQFKRYKITKCEKVPGLVGKYLGLPDVKEYTIDLDNFIWCYTFTAYDIVGKVKGYLDLSVLLSKKSIKNDEGGDVECTCNVIKDRYTSKDDHDYDYGSLQVLNNIVMLNGVSDIKEGLSEYLYTCSSNTFACGCCDITFGDNCSFNTFGNNCSYNILFDSCCRNIISENSSSNIFSEDCNDNVLSNGCSDNIFSDNCDFNHLSEDFNNTFGSSCSRNVFAARCNNNTFGNESCSNKLDNSCYDNTFGNECTFNTLGSNCHDNTFGNKCSSNSFGNSCANNTLKENCSSNSFGNSCHDNNLNKNSSRNIFGNGCFQNTFDIGCSGNNFGNECYVNRFRAYCLRNALGDDSGNNTAESECYDNILSHCTSIAFSEGCKNNILNNSSYIKFPKNSYSNIIETGVRYITLVATGDASKFLKNITIRQGVSGPSYNNRLTIEVPRDLPYNTEYYFDNLGNLTVSNFSTRITWSDLKALRDASQLVPGKQYRITDYITTTAEANTRSAGHQFDIIVTALSADKLSEEAYAILHEGDTYFANSKLNAWKLWYSIDNDTNRFGWADATNGKGVIYRMVDEFGNDLTYDFKNIIYSFVKGFLYNQWGRNYVFKRDSSLDADGYYGWRSSITPSSWSNPYCFTSVDTPTTSMTLYKNTSGTTISSGSISSVSLEEFETYTFNYVSSDSNYDASIEGLTKSCYDNVIKEYYSSNKLQLNWNVFHSTTIISECYSNTFDFNCHSNTFSYQFYYNTFGSGCYSNNFKSHCYFNTFGNDCRLNTFDSSFYYNTFGSDCYHNTFGSDCYNNTFGGSCSNNTFDTCSNNTFGYSCRYNTFGDHCYGNTFGSNCSNITFGDTSSTIDYCKNIIIDNDCSYIYLFSDDTSGSPSNYLQNVHIHLGVTGSSTSNMLSISVADRGLAYSTDYYANGSKSIVLN